MLRRCYTLIELLVVIGIIGLLLAMLLPGLSLARKSARSTVCSTNLRGIMTATLAYASTNRDCIVPSYTFNGTAAGVQRPLDGWGPILDRDGFLAATGEAAAGNLLTCPDTIDVAGMSGTQTGGEIDNPQGYMDWPAVITLSQVYATTLPDRGFHKIVRVGYWINSDNLIGAVRPIVPGIFFSSSPGYGPDPSGRVMEYNRLGMLARPSNVIAFADGLYAGRQELTRLGDADSRIGYRHVGSSLMPRCNVSFADGHVGLIAGDRFPRRATPNIPIEQTRSENLGNQPTVYSDPERFLAE